MRALTPENPDPVSQVNKILGLSYSIRLSPIHGPVCLFRWEGDGGCEVLIGYNCMGRHEIHRRSLAQGFLTLKLGARR